jgi:hypothetical protein
VKTDAQQVFENVEKWKRHQISQQADNTIYFWYAHRKKSKNSGSHQKKA